MKKHIQLLFFLGVILYSCKVERMVLNSNTGNVITDDIKDEKIYQIYKYYNFDLLISYKVSSSWIHLSTPEPYKILGRKHNKWYKIELYKAETYKSSQNKDSVALKKVSKGVHQILASYRNNNLYTLTQDNFEKPCMLRKDTIINGKKSIMVTSLGSISDKSTITFTIINNNLYKVFSCYEPWDAVNICPDIKAYQYVLNMHNTIKEYW